MWSGDNKKQPYQANRYTFPGFSDGGALAHAFMATNNQDDENKIIDIQTRQFSNNSSNKDFPQSDWISEERPSPAVVLRELALPEEIFGSFMALLTSLGYSCQRDKAVSISGTRYYTRLQNNNDQDQEQRCLIHIPEWIITALTPENEDAIIALGAAFKKDSSLIVFYRSINHPHARFQYIVERGWDRYKRCKIVPWTHIQNLHEENDRDMQIIMVEHMLGFDPT